MDPIQLGLILGTLTLVSYLAGKLLGPFAQALAKRIAEPRGTKSADDGTAELRGELDLLHERVDFLERALVALRDPAADRAKLPAPEVRIPTPV
jgi:hypothetical protein